MSFSRSNKLSVVFFSVIFGPVLSKLSTISIASSIINKIFTLRHRAHLGHITIFQRRKGGQFFGVQLFPPNNTRGSHEFRKRPGFSSGLLPTFPRGKPSCLLEKFGGIKSSNPKMKFVLSSIFRPRFSNKSIHPQTKKSNFKVSMKCKDSSFSRWWFQIFFVFTPI